MKNAIIPSLALSVLLALARPAYCAIVVDHTCLEADGSLVEIIPQTYLDQARQLKVLFCYASVGGTIINGMVGRNGLANENPERYQIGRQENADATWFDANTGIIDISRTGWPLNGGKILGDLRRRAISNGRLNNLNGEKVARDITSGDVLLAGFNIGISHRLDRRLGTQLVREFELHNTRHQYTFK